MFWVGFGNVLQGNVPGRQWVTVGIDSPWSVIIGSNRVDKESMYGRRDKPEDNRVDKESMY